MSDDVVIVQTTTNQVIVEPITNQLIVETPGPQGPQGTNGTNGTNALQSYLEFVSGQFYRPQGSQGAVSATLNTVYYAQIFIPVTTTFDRIAIKTGSTFSGTASIRLGIYANTNGKPSTVVADYGTVSATTASTVSPITISQSLTAGFYWLAAVMQSAASTNSFSGNAGNIAAYQTYQNLPYDPAMATGSVITGYIQNSVSGAFATAVPVATTGSMSLVAFIRAA
jgi:hypothetical protein